MLDDDSSQSWSSAVFSLLSIDWQLGLVLIYFLLSRTFLDFLDLVLFQLLLVYFSCCE